jgi:hypothetical protein
MHAVLTQFKVKKSVWEVFLTEIPLVSKVAVTSS